MSVVQEVRARSRDAKSDGEKMKTTHVACII